MTFSLAWNGGDPGDEDLRLIIGAYINVANRMPLLKRFGDNLVPLQKSHLASLDRLVHAFHRMRVSVSLDSRDPDTNKLQKTVHQYRKDFEQRCPQLFAFFTIVTQSWQAVAQVCSDVDFHSLAKKIDEAMEAVEKECEKSTLL